MKITAIIPAAGTGSRYNPKKHKLLEEVNGVPIIIRTLKAISSVQEIDKIIICTSPGLKEKISGLVTEYGISGVKKIILGGETRQQSVFKGLQELKKTDDTDLVVIHDGARPLVSTELIKNTINAAIEKGASIAAVPVKDTVKIVDSSTGEVLETPDRNKLWNVQTPQVFKFREIFEAHELFCKENFTDDSALMENAGYKVFVCMGSYKNIKITTEEDLCQLK